MAETLCFTLPNRKQLGNFDVQHFRKEYPMTFMGIFLENVTHNEYFYYLYYELIIAIFSSAQFAFLPMSPDPRF